MLWTFLLLLFILTVGCSSYDVYQSRLCYNKDKSICKDNLISCNRSDVIIITAVETKFARKQDKQCSESTCNDWEQKSIVPNGRFYIEYIFSECFIYANQSVCMLNDFFHMHNNDGKQNWYADAKFACVKRESMINICSATWKSGIPNATYIYYNGSECQSCYCDVTGATTLQLTALIHTCNSEDCIPVCNLDIAGNNTFSCSGDTALLSKNITINDARNRIVVNVSKGYSHLLIWIRAIGQSLHISCPGPNTAETTVTANSHTTTVTKLTTTDKSLTHSFESTNNKPTTVFSSSATSQTPSGTQTALTSEGTTPITAPDDISTENPNVSTITSGTSNAGKHTTSEASIQSQGSTDAINMAAIVGGTTGALVAMAFIVVVIVFIWYRKRNVQQGNQGSDNKKSKSSAVVNDQTTHVNKTYDYMSEESPAIIPGLSNISDNQSDIGVEYTRVDKQRKHPIQPDDGYSFAKPTEDDVTVEPNAAGYCYAQIALKTKSPNRNSSFKRMDSYSHVDLKKSNLDPNKPGNCPSGQYSHIGKDLEEGPGSSADTYNHITAYGVDSTGDRGKSDKDSYSDNWYFHINKSLQSKRGDNMEGDFEIVSNYSHIDLRGTKAQEAMAFTENVYSHMNGPENYPRDSNTTCTQQSGYQNNALDDAYSHIDHKTTKYLRGKCATDNDYAHMTEGCLHDRHIRVQENGNDEHGDYYNTMESFDGDYNHLERL